MSGVGDFDTCLKPMVGEPEWQLLRLHGAYVQHVLPLSGGLLEQPARFMEAMRVIEDQLSQKDED